MCVPECTFFCFMCACVCLLSCSCLHIAICDDSVIYLAGDHLDDYTWSQGNAICTEQGASLPIDYRYYIHTCLPPILRRLSTRYESTLHFYSQRNHISSGKVWSVDLPGGRVYRPSTLPASSHRRFHYIFCEKGQFV